MTFCTSIHCMDGRIQEPIIEYLKEKYGVAYVDTITEPGPCRILAENSDRISVGSIVKRIEISINRHGSRLIVISGHHDCTGNPCEEEIQRRQVRESVKYLRSNYPEAETIGLWIDSEWSINDV
ncbi:MAG: carbonic anhydrase [Candidatus Eisenbacteria bacterium]